MKKKLSLWTQGLKHQVKTLIKNEPKQEYPCCLKFKMLLESGSTVLYLPQTRTYLLSIDGGITYSLHYFPCCGKEFPEDLKNNRCLALYADVAEQKAFMKTKLQIDLKDCNKKLIQSSKVGE